MVSNPKKHSKRTVSSLSSRKIRIKIVGIGGGGASIVSEMAQTLKSIAFLIADTDARVFKKARGSVKVFQFGQDLAGGMGTGVDPDLAQKAALKEKEKITKIFKGQDLSIIVGSLGGGVCSGAGPVFAAAAREQKNISLGIFTLPFAFEGEKKMRIAKKALSKLQENLSGIIVVPNEKIFQLIDKKTPLKKALSSLNQAFTGWLSDLISLILKPSLINIDFADLRTILKEYGKILFFSRAVAAGPNRVEEALKKVFQNPLTSLGSKNVPVGSVKPACQPNRILFNITGGKDLKLREVADISQTVAELNPRAKIIFGITENPQYKGKIKITLLAVSDSPTRSLKGSISNGARSVASLRASRKKEAEKAARKAPKTKNKLPKPNRNGKLFGDRKEKIRRSALEVKKADEEEKEREWAQEPEWQIPTFLRKKIK